MTHSGVSLLEVLLASMLGLFTLGFGSTLVFIIYQRRMIAQDVKRQTMEIHYQQELLRAAIESQEKERTRIAHDLHDDVGMLLTTSRMYINQLSPGHAEERLAEVSDKVTLLFDEMMRRIRQISHDLRPVILENLGLIEAVESLHEKLEEAGLLFYFTHEVPFRLTRNAELVLYRVIQELISNTLKHAHAENIYLSMKVKGSLLYMVYKDDGTGLRQTGHASRGLGMKSIESRLKLINSRMSVVEQTTGACFSIEIDIDKLI